MALPSSSVSHYHSSDRLQSLPYHTIKPHIPRLCNISQSPSDVIETDSKQASRSPSVLPLPQLSERFVARSPFLAGEREERDMKKTPTTPVSLPGQPGSQGTASIVSRSPHPLMGSYQSITPSSSGRSLHQPLSGMQSGQNVTPVIRPAPESRTALRQPDYPPQRQLGCYSNTSLSSEMCSSMSAESPTEPKLSFPYQQLPPHSTSHTFRHYVDIPTAPPKHTRYQYCSNPPVLQSVSQYGESCTPLLHEQSSSSQPNSLTQDYQSTVPSGVERTTSEINMLHICQMQRSNPINVTVEPHDCEVFPNERAEFLCKAYVTGCQDEPTFLWYKDEQPLVGEVSNEFVVDKATEEDTGTYFCLVTDSSNRYQRKSRNAKLTLIEHSTAGNSQGAQKRALEITEQPGPYIEATAGKKLQLTVKVKGEAPLRYKWYKDTRELMYATTNILEIPSANQLDNGQYCCAVANDHGSILSEIYQVKVIQRPKSRVVSNQQRETPMSPSATTTLAQYIDQPRPTSFQKWDNQPVTDLFLQEVGQQVAKQTCNWSRLALFLGLTTKDVVQSRMHFHQPEEQAFQLLRIWRERKNGGDKSTLQTILSQAGINLDVLFHTSTAGSPAVKPRITLQPRSLNVVYGQSARIFVEVENASNYNTYQWYRNNEILRGKVGPELLISSSVDSDRGEYFCMITNQAGYTVSQVARIDVVDIHPESLHYGTAQQSMYSSDPWNSTYVGYHSRGSTTAEGLNPKDQHIPGTGVASTSIRLDDKIPCVVKHPESQMIEPGSALTLTCAGVGAGELSYLWYFNGLSLKDETGPEYSINCFTDEDEGMYACQVTNMYGHVMSNMAHVVMKLN